MAKPRPIRVPKLCRRKDTGRLYCTDPQLRRPVYFQTQLEYENWRADFIARNQSDGNTSESVVVPPGSRLSVLRFCEAWMEHARQWYRKDGEPTSQVDLQRTITKRLCKILGERQVNSLRSSDIEAVLQHMVGEGLARRTINAFLTNIKRMFRWGVRKDYVSGETLGRVVAVAPLRQGRTAAREKPRVGPATNEQVEAVLQELPRVVRSMLLLQWYAGMRPGEICRLRPGEIDTTGATWQYCPEKYKTQHRHEDAPELRRRIWFGPKAREILEPLLHNAVLDMPLFRTRQRRVMTVGVYRRAITRACERAGVKRFSPNQLRHSTATLVREKYGIEAARVYLGHENLKTSEIYAEQDDELARRIAEEIG